MFSKKNRRERTKETIDRESKPKYGLWYYIVPALLFLIVHIFFAHLIFNEHSFESRYYVVKEVIFSFWIADSTYQAWTVIGMVVANIVLALYYLFVRLINNVVYKKDPLRILVKIMSAFNAVIVPAIIVVSLEGGFFDWIEFFVFLIFYGFYFVFFGVVFGLLYCCGVLDLNGPTPKYIRDYQAGSGYSSYSSYYDEEEDDYDEDDEFDCPSYSNHSRESSGGFFSGFGSSRNYIGSHGEFDANDRERAYNEDILQFRSNDKDFDAREHFGWEHELNYDSDGYRDEE